MTEREVDEMTVHIGGEDVPFWEAMARMGIVGDEVEEAARAATSGEPWGVNHGRVVTGEELLAFLEAAEHEPEK